MLKKMLSVVVTVVMLFIMSVSLSAVSAADSGDLLKVNSKVVLYDRESGEWRTKNITQYCFHVGDIIQVTYKAKSINPDPERAVLCFQFKSTFNGETSDDKTKYLDYAYYNNTYVNIGEMSDGLIANPMPKMREYPKDRFLFNYSSLNGKNIDDQTTLMSATFCVKEKGNTEFRTKINSFYTWEIDNRNENTDRDDTLLIEHKVEMKKVGTLLKKGDANCDGKVDVTDVTLIQKYIAKLVEFDEIQLSNSNTDGNSVVNVMDVTRTQKYIAKAITEL